jgi:hypothetical protein
MIILKKLAGTAAVLILLAVVAAGCSDKQESSYMFEGESASWEAEYKVDITTLVTKENGINKYDIKETSEFVLTYKGDVSSLANAGHLTYSFTNGRTGGSEELSFESPPEEGKFTHKSLSNSDDWKNFDFENGSVDAEVVLDGVAEHIKLLPKH